MNADVYWRMGYAAYPGRKCPLSSLSPEGQRWWQGWEAARVHMAGEPRPADGPPRSPTSDPTIGLALRDRQRAAT